MAIGAPTSIGSAQVLDGGSTTRAFTLTSAVAAGQFIIVAVAAANVSGISVTFSDTKNTYATDVQNTATTSFVAIGSAQVTTALTTSDVITATFSASEAARMIVGVQVAGIASASALDKSTSGTGTAVGWSSGATAATTQADELVVAACTNDSTAAETSTPGGSFTELFDFSTSSALNMTFVYQIVAATGAQTGSGTWTNSGSRTWGAAVATYKGSTARVPMPTVVDTAVARAANY